MQEVVNWFLNGDSAWALLFTFLFVYVLKIFREREKENDLEIKKLQEILQQDVQKVNRDLEVVIDVWKTLIQEELKKRKNEQHYKTKG